MRFEPTAPSILASEREVRAFTHNGLAVDIFKVSGTTSYRQLTPLLATPRPRATFGGGGASWADALVPIQLAAKAGFGRAARRFADRFGNLIAVGTLDLPREAAAFLAELRRRLESIPDGVIEWSSRRPIFLRNLDALRCRDVRSAEIIARADSALDRYELFRLPGGVFQVLDLESLEWRPALEDHRATARAAFEGERPLPVNAPIVFDGIGHGWMLDEFFRRTANVFLSYSPPVDVVEPDPVALAIVLHLRDWSTLLAAERVSVFVGSDAEARYLAALDADPRRPAPRMVQRCLLTLRPPTALHESLAALWRRRIERKVQLKSAVASRLDGRDHRAWAERFEAALSGRGAPLRILGLTSRFTTVLRYSMSELLAAAARAGCATRLAWEQADHGDDPDLLGAIDDFQPDLVVIISRMRHEIADIPRGLPCVTWDQDNLPCMRSPAAAPSLDRLTFVVGYGAQVGRTQLGWPASQALAMAPAAMAAAYDETPVSKDLLSRFRCDIAYVSHCSESPGDLRDRLAAQWRFHPLLLAMFQSVTDRILDAAREGHNWTPGEVFDLLQEAASDRSATLEDDVNRELFFHCTTISDRAFRHCALEWAARYARESGRTFRIYGNRWERHPRFAPFAAGVARFGDEFRAACQAAQINLQLIEGGFIHSRALDGLAAGGFFLTRSTRWDLLRPYIRNRSVPRPAGVESLTSAALDWWAQTILPEPDACAVFPMLPRVSFSNFDEFASRCEEFLADEPARAEIAAEMRTIARKHFSYDRHLAEMLRFIRQSLSSV